MGCLTLILRNLHWSHALLAIADLCDRIAPVAVGVLPVGDLLDSITHEVLELELYHRQR